MARLPIYVNQAGLDTGADTFRLAPDSGAQIAAGIRDFGNALVGAGERIGNASLRAENKDKAKEERDAALRDEVEYIRLGDRVQQFAVAQQDKVGDDAAGYTRSVESFAQDEYSKLLQSGRLSGENKAKHDLMFERVRNGIVDKASTYEAKTKLEFRHSVYEDTIKNLTAFAGTTGASGLDQATQEWKAFVERTEGGTNTRLGKKVYEFGLRRIEQQAFKAEALKRGPEFMAKFQGLMTETPSATTGNAQVDATLKHAPANGIDPKTAIAIGWIESRLNMDHGKPIGRDGRPMSSAEGGWQILDGVARDFKLSIAEKRDPEKATAAVMKHFAQNKGRLEQLGHQATPGKLYMFWNVGQGVAERILKADPNTPIEQIIYSSYPSRPGLAAQVLRNNPSMYRAGMTAGQVLANYERQMERATAATSKYFSGTPVQSDDQTRALVSSFMGRDVSGVGTADLVETFADVSKTIKSDTEKQRNIAAGEFYLSNPGAGDPYDKQRRKEVNAAVENRIGDALVQGIARGDVASLPAARQFVDAAGFIPDKVLHGYRAAIDSNSTEPAMLAMQSLAQIERENPIAFKASDLQADEKSMVNDYRAFTEVLGLDPSTAATQILFYRTPEGKKQRQALADKTKAEWRNGGTEQDAEATAWSEIKSGFDRNGVWPGSPDTVTDVQRDALVEAYRMGIVHNRLQGYDATLAKARSITTLGKVWGVSAVGDSTRSQTLMPLPPEKVFAGKAINGSYDWVREQASNTLGRYLESTGRRKPVERTDEFGNVHVNRALSTDFKLVPSAGAIADFINDRPVSYDIWYRDDKGMVQRAVGVKFTPDYNDAKAKADADFSREREGRLSKRQSTPADPSMIVAP